MKHKLHSLVRAITMALVAVACFVAAFNTGCESPNTSHGDRPDYTYYVRDLEIKRHYSAKIATVDYDGHKFIFAQSSGAIYFTHHPDCGCGHLTNASTQ